MPVAVPRAKYRARVAAALPDLAEQQLQIAVFDWLGTVELRNAIVFHVPNGRKLDRLEASLVNRLGVRKGVADLAVMLEDGRQGWIELKSPKGELEREQGIFRQQCMRLGHHYLVCRNLQSVQHALVLWGVTWGQVDLGGSFRAG